MSCVVLGCHHAASLVPPQQPCTPEPIRQKEDLQSSQCHAVRREVAELVETLVDVSHHFGVGSLSHGPSLRLRKVLAEAHGATLASDDVAVLRAIRTIDGQIAPPRAASFLWGAASRRQGEEAEGEGELERTDGGTGDAIQKVLLRRLRDSPPDPRRCALSVLYFPDHRSPGGLGDEDEGEGWASGAAYDPAVIVPLMSAALDPPGGCSPADLRLMCQLGVLSVCIRALSSWNEAMRGTAVTAVRLYQVRRQRTGADAKMASLY